MKMQTLAVIFAIIIIPISIVVSIYIQTQIDTLALQTTYDTKLNNATYDAVKAFQLNEINSNTQNIATEKIRDIEASVETFYNSLAMSLKLGAFDEEQLSAYVPALVYTLYEGYYLYGPFKNISNSDKYENGLKPFVYYSARYKKGLIDITVNYTLDNYVTIYGTDETGSYVTNSGYLINPDDVQGGRSNLTYKGIRIEQELLTEINTETYSTNTYVPYVYKTTENDQKEKVYLDESDVTNNTYYRISLDRKRINLKQADNPKSKYDATAVSYYLEARDFSNWVRNHFGSLCLRDAVGYNQDTADNNIDRNIYYISNEEEINKQKIFELTGTNDPENEKSVFNEHRRNVIKYTIQTNLSAAIAGYNAISQINDTTYNFKMPTLTEEDWDKLLNNVSIISFMQGFPIKNKFYNGYSIVTNNKNREFIDPYFIYFTSGSTDRVHSVYHTSAFSSGEDIIGYRNLDFARRKITDEENNTQYYYAQRRDYCYDCIVTSFARSTDKTFFEYMNSTEVPDGIKKAYYTAIGRERYNSYKSNKLYINEHLNDIELNSRPIGT